MSACKSNPAEGRRVLLSRRSRLAAMANALLKCHATRDYLEKPLHPIRARLPSFLSFTKSMWM